MSFHTLRPLFKDPDDKSVEDLHIQFGFKGKHIIFCGSMEEIELFTSALECSSLPRDQWEVVTQREWRRMSGLYDKAEIRRAAGRGLRLRL